MVDTLNITRQMEQNANLGTLDFYLVEDGKGKLAWTGTMDLCRPHICHRYHRLYLWRKICHVEKFQISVKNLNNLWSFIEIYAVFVLNLCGEKSVWRKSLWRKNDKYEVWSVTCESLVSREFSRIILQFHFSISISRHFNFTFTSRKK